MNWSTEPWIKQYKRRTVEWSMASFDARGLYNELATLVDKGGYLVLGRAGVAGLAHVLNLPVDRCQAALEELQSHEWAVLVGDRVLLPSHADAQGAVTSNQLRQANFRERKRAEALDVDDDPSRDVTRRNAESRAVTQSNDKKEEKEEKRKKESPVPSDVALSLATHLFDSIRSHSPDATKLPKDVTGWALELDRGIRAGVTADRFRLAIDYAHRDPRGVFWQPNIRSASSLREKLDTLEGQMRGNGKARPPPRQQTLQEAGIRTFDELEQQRRKTAQQGES